MKTNILTDANYQFVHLVITLSPNSKVKEKVGKKTVDNETFFCPGSYC